MAEQKIVSKEALTAIASDIKTAIAEKADKYTDITGTLSAGQTSITLSNIAITENSTIDYYTNYFGINPVGVNVSNGRVVLTFEEQDIDISVKVRVS
jgi:hypothetical protein